MTKKHPTLKEHTDEAEKFARGYFNDNGQLAPMIDAIDEDGLHYVMLVPQIGGTGSERDAIATGLAQFFKEKKIIQYVMMIEAWTLKMSQDELIAAGGEVPRPSLSPNRVEIVCLQGETWKGENYGRSIDIDRSDGKAKLTTAMEFPSGSTTGRFCNLLHTPSFN